MSVPLGGVVINGVKIEDVFAEAFAMTATRIVITAVSYKWAQHAAENTTGFATSIIGCGVEADIERRLSPFETPDGRPGIAVLLFTANKKELARQLAARIGQCVLTCPTTALYAGMEGDDRVPMGDHTRYFGDGHQIAKRVGGRRFWRIPVMDGEFLCEDSTAVSPAIGGGNFIIMARSQAEVLQAGEAAIDAMARLDNIILPFPGGGVRSGSKVGSRYKNLAASTHERFCPTLQGATASALAPGVEAAMEIVVNGLGVQDIINAMRAGMQAVCHLGPANGITGITAGNYGGKLGKYEFHLWEILGDRL